MMPFKTILKCVAIVLSAALMHGCKVTQPYRAPAGIAPDSLFREQTSTDSQSMANIPWNQLFADSLLRSLIAEGIQHNPNLQIAVARISEAEANFRQSKAAFLPAVDASVSATLQKSGTSQVAASQVYQGFASASWEADIWGKLRSAKRASLAALLQSEAYRRTVQTQLVSDIATNYFLLMSYDAQLELTLRTVENRKLDVETVKALKESDVVTGAAVVQSEANRYAAEVTIPDLRQNIRQTENAISVLLGRAPGAVLRDSLMNETMTDTLQTGLPAQLLANRPDVMQAEDQFRYQFELTNIARTYFYPSLTITGEGGVYSAALNNFFNTAALFGNLIGGLTQPIFNRGLNRQRLEVARAQQNEALITYRQTLLTAGEEVSNALSEYRTATDKIGLRSQQIAFLEKAVDYTQQLLKYTSNTNFTDVLTSEQSLLAAQLNHISDKLEQLQAVVNVYRSLGGGWR